MNTLSNNKKIKIIGLCGSLRQGSYTHMALELAIQKANSLGAEATILDISKMTIPFCTGEDSYPDYPDVSCLRESVKNADALILATPEYHGSLSGVLKNVLDLMGFEEFTGKVCATIAILGGAHNSNALNDLRLIIRQVHGWVIPEQVAIGNAYKMFDPQKNLVDTSLQDRLDKMVESLMTNTCKLRA